MHPATCMDLVSILVPYFACRVGANACIAGCAGHLPNARACGTFPDVDPRIETPYKAALLAGGAAADAAASANQQPPAAAGNAAAAPALPLRRMPLGDLTNIPQPHKGDPVAKLSTAKPRPGRTSGGKARPPDPTAAATAAAAAPDAAPQQRLVPLGSLAPRRTAFQHPPCSAAAAPAPLGALAGANRMPAPLPSVMQQPLLQSSSTLMMPPAVLADPTPQHAMSAAAAGGMRVLPGSMMPATYQKYFAHAEHSDSSACHRLNNAAFVQQAAAHHAASAGISNPAGYIDFAGRAPA